MHLLWAKRFTLAWNPIHSVFKSMVDLSLRSPRNDYNAQFHYVYYTFYSDQVNWRAVWHFASIHYTKDPTQKLSSSSVQHQTSVITPKNTCVWWFKVRHQKSPRRSLYYLESRKFFFYLSDPTIICSKFTMSITFQIWVSMFVWAFFFIRNEERCQSFQ